MRTCHAPVFAILASLAVGCGGPAPDDARDADAPPPERRETLVVYTTSYPLAFFAERIGGENVTVEFPVPAGIDPAYWTPSAGEIAAYQVADVILLNGAGFERWVGRSSLPGSKLVNTSAAFEDLYIVAEEAVVHTHGPEGEHEHENVAFTTWLDPALAIEQARAVRGALVARLPGAEADFTAGFDSLAADLSRLDDRLEAWATARTGEPILASHPVYQYLARRYDLNLRSVHFEPGEVPSSGGWLDLAALLQEHPARWMLWEAEPVAETRQRLASDFRVTSVVFEPCGNRPASGDYLGVMMANVDALETLPVP